MSARIATRQPFEGQIRFRRADGEYRWLRSSGVPRCRADGSLIGYVGCSVDITDIKRSEETLREADRRKDEFLATLAHELRNPLAPMRNGAPGARGTGGPRARHGARASIMERQLDQMVRLVDDLLDVVAHQPRQARAAHASGSTCADVLRTALRDRRAGARRLPAAPGDRAAGGAAPLDGDPTRLAQVFVNLLDNATKYTTGERDIRLDARRARRAPTCAAACATTASASRPRCCRASSTCSLQGDVAHGPAPRAASASG